jgi:hypothetical protein
LRRRKKEFQFRAEEGGGGVEDIGGREVVVVEAFRVPILQIEGVKKELGGLVGGGVAERRESLEEVRRWVGLYCDSARDEMPLLELAVALAVKNWTGRRPGEKVEERQVLIASDGGRIMVMVILVILTDLMDVVELHV